MGFMTDTGFTGTLESVGRYPLRTADIHTLQVNVGLLCNQACTHCHHQAGPERTEVMSQETMSAIIEKAKKFNIPTIDITGGAPEMNPHIREFITGLKENGHHIMLRTNLTALMDERYTHMARFYKENGIELIASLPCYEMEEVDCVRGDGVFEKSIEALKMLNGLGYGKELKLNLVFNPMADFLPPPQDALKEEYIHELGENFGITFSELFTITNMPMGRFREDLEKDDKLEPYMKLLIDNFNPSTLDNLMCLFQINVGWDGRMYDCDFNQAMGITTIEGFPDNILDLKKEHLQEREIVLADHCFGCTAGAGSSCGGALLD